MRIISKFTDYYDYYQSFGYDKSNVWIRKTRKLNNKEIIKKSISFIDNMYSILPRNKVEKNSRTEFDIIVIIICGKIHYGVRTKTFIHGTVVPIMDYFYDYNDFLISYNYAKNNRLKYILNNTFDITEYMIKKNIPILMYIYNRSNISYSNPKLLNYKFQKKMKCNEIWQELDMFISGINNIEKEGKIPDEYMLKQKGFDCRSFKNNSRCRKIN